VPVDPSDPTTFDETSIARTILSPRSPGFATFSPDWVLTVSPFFHYNSANYRSDPNDVPSAATQDRSSKYEGGQAAFPGSKGAITRASVSTASPAGCSILPRGLQRWQRHGLATVAEIPTAAHRCLR